MRICVDPDSMRSRSDDIKVINGDLKSYMDQVENLVLSIGGEWQGDAERAYVARIVYVKKQFSTIMKFIEDYSLSMNEIAQEYEEFDKELSSKINLA